MHGITHHHHHKPPQLSNPLINPNTQNPTRLPMEKECMKTCMKKLAIWYTPNFKPIITHEELDHYLSMHGFISQAPVSTSSTPAAGNTGAGVMMWKEYKYSGAGPFLLKSKRLPCPRLPYPRIDGLHEDTYRAFLESVNFYLGKTNIADLFHIRGIPLYHAHDRSQKWLRMDGDDLVYVYRDGTMELTDNCDNDKDQNQLMKVVPCKNITDRML